MIDKGEETQSGRKRKERREKGVEAFSSHYAFGPWSC